MFVKKSALASSTDEASSVRSSPISSSPLASRSFWRRYSPAAALREHFRSHVNVSGGSGITVNSTHNQPPPRHIAAASNHSQCHSNYTSVTSSHIHFSNCKPMQNNSCSSPSSAPACDGGASDSPRASASAENSKKTAFSRFFSQPGESSVSPVLRPARIADCSSPYAASLSLASQDRRSCVSTQLQQASPAYVTVSSIRVCTDSYSYTHGAHQCLTFRKILFSSLLSSFFLSSPLFSPLLSSPRPSIR